MTAHHVSSFVRLMTVLNGSDQPASGRPVPDVRFGLAMSVLAALLVLVAGPTGAGHAQNTAGAGTTKTNGIVTTEHVRSSLAQRLGVSGERLAPQTDLLNDLQLDTAVVHYALLALYNEFKVAPPARELTQVMKITEFVTEAAVRRVSKKASKVKSASYVQTVFYATNRNLTGSEDPINYYGADRSSDRQLKLGVAQVNIPYSHKKGQLETPWLKYKVFFNPNKHIYVLNLDPLSNEDFYSRLAGSGDASNDVMVYVHGFNVSFDDSVVRAGQVAFDFGFKGATIAFSWPSNRSITPLAYTADWADVIWSVKYIEEFLVALRERMPGKKIHLVAHSMGSRGVLHALRLLARRKNTQQLFTNVVLCAPDFDAELFAEQVAPEIRNLTKNLVVYASGKDSALTVSKTINATPRLGSEPLGAESYQVINASKVEVSPWSVPEAHSYYATKKKVILDMINALKGRSPKDRGLAARAERGGPIWFFN